MKTPNNKCGNAQFEGPCKIRGIIGNRCFKIQRPNNTITVRSGNDLKRYVTAKRKKK